MSIVFNKLYTLEFENYRVFFFNILSFITQQEDNEFFLYINEKSYLGFGDEKIRLFVLGMSQVSKTTSLSYGVTFLCFHCQ